MKSGSPVLDKNLGTNLMGSVRICGSDVQRAVVRREIFVLVMKLTIWGSERIKKYKFQKTFHQKLKIA